MRRVLCFALLVCLVAGCSTSIVTPSDELLNEPYTETLLDKSSNAETSIPQLPLEDKIDIPNEGILIFDYDGIRITALSVDRSFSQGCISCINLLLENNTDIEKNICV